MLDKKLFLDGELRIIPKFDLTHADLDVEVAFRREQVDANFLRLKSEREAARKETKENRAKLLQKIREENEKHERKVTEAKQKLLKTDRKYNSRYFPLRSQEKRMIELNAKKQAQQTGIDNDWMFEDKEVNAFLDRKRDFYTLKYIQWQFLNKGIVPSKKASSPLETEINTLFSDSTQPLLRNIENIPGRRQITMQTVLDKYIDKG